MPQNAFANPLRGWGLTALAKAPGWIKGKEGQKWQGSRSDWNGKEIGKKREKRLKD